MTDVKLTIVIFLVGYAIGMFHYPIWFRSMLVGMRSLNKQKGKIKPIEVLE